MYESLMEEASSCHRLLRRRNAAGFNRRMRKTARPVVWEGDRAEIPVTRPDQTNFFTRSDYQSATYSAIARLSAITAAADSAAARTNPAIFG